MNKSRILDEALSVELLPTLQKVPTPRNANTTKHCRYHQNYGHTTDECVALKDKIKELIRAGHLQIFVQYERKAPITPRGTRTMTRHRLTAHIEIIHEELSDHAYGRMRTAYDLTINNQKEEIEEATPFS